MEALQAIAARHSMRDFEGKPVSRKNIETIADAGRTAPSAKGEHPWEFLAVTEKKTLLALGKICDHGAYLKDAGAAIVVACRDTKYYLEDGSAATENMLIAATALEIGSCWVAGDKKPYAQKILELFKFPPGYKLVSIIALGYPMQKTGLMEKRSLKEVLHWGTF